MLTVLHAPATHLYPGLEGTVVPDQAAALQPLQEGVIDCVVEFSDGSSAFGRLEPDDDGRRWLALQAYTTARGTEIPPKRWHLAITPDRESAPIFRVVARGPKSTS